MQNDEGWAAGSRPNRAPGSRGVALLQAPDGRMTRTMTVTFPGESSEYRRARDRLLEAEVALRRQMEAVAAARRALPPGGIVPEDYVFDGIDKDGRASAVRMSELFVSSNSLVIYS